MVVTLSQRIKIELIKKGVTCADIGRKLGVNRSTVIKTVSGETTSYRIRKAIADAINIPYKYLWEEPKRSKLRK